MYDTSIKHQLFEINQDLIELTDRTRETISVSSDETFDDWRHAAKLFEQRLEDDLLRMAVVGTIKSGKSTFINALFSGDYLKRGAGVITSIVTKARRSDRLRAVLSFKSWHELNSEIEQALQLFPTLNWRSTHEAFDIRKAKDRDELSSALANLESKHFWSKGLRSTSSVLLAACLKGYPEVREIVSDQTETVVFEGNRFVDHQMYAGSEYLSVFLKDIHLEIPSGDLDRNIEIADCQGSDSPNPLHLAMIQDYLRTADLVVYLISSRTGLRQADIKFLNMIKQMVGTTHLLFVINADFNEHESLADLQRVAAKSREDLELIVKDPPIYIFSALYTLFSARKEILPEKDRLRLDQWVADPNITTFSDHEKKRFEHDFLQLITEQRYSLLLKNHLQRLQLMTADFRRLLDLNRDILSSDAAGAGVLLKKIKQQQKKTERIKAMIKSTLDGASNQLKREIRAEVDRFYDTGSGPVAPAILEYVKNYTIPYEQYGDQLTSEGFSDTLTAVFQMFKQDLDRYMAEQFNPALFRFLREKEADIADQFESITRPYDIMVTETLVDYRMTGGEPIPENGGPENGRHIELESLKTSRGLSVPMASATLDYSTALKTEAFMKLGFYRFVNTIKKVFRKSKTDYMAEIPALKSGVARMKKETETSLVFHFKNSKENIKFQYLFKLIESVSDEMFIQLVNRFKSYQTDLSNIKAIAGQDQGNKAASLERIDEIAEVLSQIRSRVGDLKKQIRT